MSDQPQKPIPKKSVLEDKQDFGKADAHAKREEDAKARDEMKQMGEKAGERT